MGVWNDRASRHWLLTLAYMNSVNTNDCRELDVSCCCVLRFRTADVSGAPRTSGHEWQYILIAAFSSYICSSQVRRQLGLLMWQILPLFVEKQETVSGHKRAESQTHTDVKQCRSIWSTRATTVFIAPTATSKFKLGRRPPTPLLVGGPAVCIPLPRFVVRTFANAAP